MEIIIGIDNVIIGAAIYFNSKKLKTVVEAQPASTPAPVVAAIAEGAGVVDIPAKAKRAPAKKAPAKTAAKPAVKKPAAKKAPVKK
jgi:hypothetical protein